MTLSSVPTIDQVTLLSFCRIKGVSWYLIAREAMRPDGLQRLLNAHLTERSAEVTKAKPLLSKASKGVDALREEAYEIASSALSDGIRLTTVLDEDYPLNLRTIFNRPPFLFYRGELRQEEDARSVAVVGTRKPTDAGVKRAGKMARLLAENGVTVLSGLARGIDTAAHEATLHVGERTVAVLGSGIRRVYPADNTELAGQITAHGAVVSQFWPDSPPATYTFPRRNVTMSGLGQGTIVVEASATSGAKMQARLALEHGKKVFLLESLVAEHSWARSYLRRGAKQVKTVADVLTHLRSAEQIRDDAHERFQLSLGL